MPYAHGIGFAVPTNIAKTVVTELIQNGRVINRPWIGISYVKITRQLAQYYRLPTKEGVCSDNVATKARFLRPKSSDMFSLVIVVTPADKFGD
jgi:S1-C subfamily serine protease